MNVDKKKYLVVKNMVLLIKRYKILSCYFVKGCMVKLFDFFYDFNKRNKYDMFCL